MQFLTMITAVTLGSILGVTVAVALDIRSVNPVAITRAIRKDMSR
jgi:hypothetical protein